MSSLTIQGLSKSFGPVQALREVDLTIAPGVFGLLGPNGAGKTTLMRVLTLLAAPTQGSIRYGDLIWSPKRRTDILRRIGYLPQTFAFFPYLTVREALEYAAYLKRVPEKTLRADVAAAMEAANLTELARRRVGKLSGGMLRRLGVAQALVGDPEILIIDEPTAGLDPQERLRLRNILWSLGRQRLVLLSTHIVQDVEAICDTVAILSQGRVLACAAPERLLSQAQGRVFTRTLSQAAYASWAGRQEVVSFTTDPAGVHVRYLRDGDDGVGAPAAPTLEDAYLWILKGGEAP